MQSKFLKSISLPKLSFESIPISKESGLIALILISFLIVDIFLSKALLGPAKKHFQEVQETEALIRTKPHLEFLLQDGNQLLSDWKSGASPVEGAAAVLREIQNLAAENHVQVREIASTGRQSGQTSAQVGGTAFARETVTLEAIGTFNDLAKWIDVVEDKPGLFVDSWRIVSSKDNSNENKMSLNLNVISSNS